jgi:hypothetical protein
MTMDLHERDETAPPGRRYGSTAKAKYTAFHPLDEPLAPRRALSD